MLFAISDTAGIAIAGGIVLAGLVLMRWLFTRQPPAPPVSNDPLLAMFDKNRADHEERKRQRTAALTPDDPLREWVARGADLGWLGFSEVLFGLYFEENPSGAPGEVRALKLDSEKEPNLKDLPALAHPFGVELAGAPTSDRGLAALAGYHSLVALSAQSLSTFTDASMKHVCRMADLVALDVRFTGLTERGLGRLAELGRLQYLALYCEEGAEFVASLTGLRGLSTGPLSDNGVRALRGLSELALLCLSHGVTDAGLQHLAPLGRLRVLEVNTPDVTDAGLQHLAALAALEKLKVRGYEGSIRGTGLVGLRGLSQLRELDLSYNAVTASGLAGLVGLGALRTLDLSDNVLTGPGVESLVGLTGLHRLNLSQNPLTDADLARLELPAGLQTLGLDGLNITDAGLARLRLPDSVTTLSLARVPITDASVATLAQWTTLQELCLARTSMSFQAAQRLADALPMCRIQAPAPY